MKRLCYLLLWTLLCCWLPGCTPEEGQGTGPVPLKVTVVDGVPVKSSHTKPDAEVRNLTVALYGDGVLRKEYYYTSTTGLSLADVGLSRHYTVYALANAGHVSFPASESGVASMSVAWSSVSAGDVWPMAFIGELDAQAGAVLSMPLVRLVARVDLTVDTGGLSLYRFSAQQVRLMSGAVDCRPFVDRSVPLNGTVRTDTASAADVTALNGGGATSYYLFESCFGNLLPDNHDAWEKVPSNLSGDVAPPYVEIAGVLTVDDNSGTTRDVTYRFYLGQNTTRNFDVVRNTVNTVTLQLTDENVDRGSWKVEAGPFTERASIAFARSTLEIPWLSSGSVGVNVSPANLKFRVYEKDGSMSDAGLSFRVNGKTVVVTSTRGEATTGTLYAGTIDGRLECSCRISTVEPPVTLKKVVLKCTDQYDSYRDAYVKDLGRWFTCMADLTYSDGTVLTDVTDLSEFDWIIADEDVIRLWSGQTSILATDEVGQSTAYIRHKETKVCSNSLLFIVYQAGLNVRANPSKIDCGGSSTLFAYYGGRDVHNSATWTILEGSQYGYIESDLYDHFVSNGSNTSNEEIVIEGRYQGHTATCTIEISAPQGGGGDIISKELVVTPLSASIDYDGSESFTATCYTLRNGYRTGESRDVTGLASWSVSNTDAAKVSARGFARGCNTSQEEQTTLVIANYAGYSASASLTVGPAPDNPDPGPGPDPGPDPDDPVLTGITLDLDKAKIWYGETVQASVTAWYDDGSSRDVTGQVAAWPTLDGCSRSENRYTHCQGGLRTDALCSLTVTYGSFGATAEFTLGRQYTARVEAVFPETISWSSERAEKPSYRLVCNDGTTVEGHPGDMDYFTVDDGPAQDGGLEIGPRDYSVGTHLLTVYVNAPNRSGGMTLMSGSKSFTVIQ